MSHANDPRLDPQERALAEQLARIAPRGEPSATLDARILAMAQRGIAENPTVSAIPHPRRRWPVWLGVAASLTVVAGLVWRLEPLLHPGQPVVYEAPARVPADTDRNGQRQPIDYVATDAAAEAPPPPPPPAAAASAPAPRPVPADRTSTPRDAVRAPTSTAASAASATKKMQEAAAEPDNAASVAATAGADRSLAQEVPRRPSPSSPETAARNAAASPRLRSQSLETQAQAQADAAVAEPVAAPPPAAAPAPMAAPPVLALPPPTQDRAGFDARPPATADQPAVQRAWLARIRELRDGGETEAARSSLRAFVQRYPKAELPADLKPLLETGAATP